ncbi:MAG: fatty acyl-AMP ligase [Acidimicrobiia bacterium]
MRTLLDRIEKAAGKSGSVTFVVGGGEDRVPWRQLHDEARDVAAMLQSMGIRRGGHVSILAPTSRALVTAMQATWLAGATLIVLPLPMRLASLEEFTEQTKSRVANADTDLLIVDNDLAPFLGDAVDAPGAPPLALLQDLLAKAASNGAAAYERPAVEPDDLAILQFTSGSTSDPKGVMIPHRIICANHDAMVERARMTDADVLVSWLPLYHDMGLVGLLLLGMAQGVDLVLAAPQDFLADPGRWMEWIDRYGGTATAGPNFSWVLAGRALRLRKEPLDLSSLRIALNGAEPVDPATVRTFIEAGARHRLDPGAVFPAFGMAEVAIGGTFPDPGSGLRTDLVDARVLENESYAAPAPAEAEGARELVRLGKVLGGMELRVVDPQTGDPRSEREVGELEIRGTSVTPGYYNNPEATEALFRDGWLRTGDLAYLVDEDLVICGRIKDVIIVGGRNVYPQDVERAVAEVDGVRAGNVIAFGINGRHNKETLVVVAETKLADRAALTSAVHHKVREAVGLPVKDVVLVAPGSLPKTSSGKLQRALCKQRYLAEELQLA